jgi:hypothetical protein
MGNSFNFNDLNELSLNRDTFDIVTSHVRNFRLEEYPHSEPHGAESVLTLSSHQCSVISAELHPAARATDINTACSYRGAGSRWDRSWRRVTDWRHT